MELRDLRFFCLTAETQHVTRSAEKLGISQSSLTRIIGQIEDEIGGALFERTGRNIRLTHNGRVFYRYAKKVIDDIDVLITEMDYVFDRKERTVTLLCNTNVFASWMIFEFRKTAPKYAISVLQASKEDMLSALKSGEADFALCCPPITDNSENLITTELAFYEEPLLLFPPGHRLLEKSTITIEDIRGEALVTMQKNSALRNILDPFFSEHALRPHIICETDNIDMIIQTVAGGAGYAFVSKPMMEKYPELMQYCLSVDMPVKRAYFGLSYLKDALKNRNNSHYRDFLTEALKRLCAELYGPAEP